MGDERHSIEFMVDQSGERLDKVLAARLETLSRMQIQGLIRDGLVMVNGKPSKSSYRLEVGEHVQVQIPVVEADTAPQPEAIPLEVLYENDDLAVINKPAGMVVHPAYGHTTGTLVNAVLARWPPIASWGEPERAGIVHRLDKETSGVLLIAKTPESLDYLRTQFKDRTIEKRYLALVEGNLDTPEGIIDAPIGRDPSQRKRMAVVRDGREAVTEFHVIEHYHEFSLVEVYPKTGRTHQIRVHLAFIGHPVVGDTVYGRRRQRLKMNRHFLHAASLAFPPAGSGEIFAVEAPLPVPLQDILNKLPR